MRNQGKSDKNPFIAVLDPEVYSEPCQTFKMKHFGKIVNC